VIEQAPVHDRSGSQLGVVAEGAVGSRAGRLRILRYEIRLRPGGHIPDVADPPVRFPRGGAASGPEPLTPPSREK
jgi:hypothetical protein